MNKYNDTRCPVCNNDFSDTDNIVVCPVCGTAHHKECYNHLGHCIKEDKHHLMNLEDDQHSSDECKQDQTIKQDDTDKSKNNLATICPNCGTFNYDENETCQKCGKPLNLKKSQFDVFEQMNIITEKTIKIKLDEEIDGVSIRDLDLFIGKNSLYYINMFRRLSKSKLKVSFNGAAFLGNFAFYLNRKMFYIAIPLLILFLAYFFPNLYLSIQEYKINMFNMPISPIVYKVSEFTRNIYSITNILIFINGILGNWVYKNHVYSKIEKIKAENLSEQEYINKLKSNGGTNLVGTLITLGIIILIAIIVMFVAAFFMVYNNNIPANISSFI